jgi:hypothetical protein
MGERAAARPSGSGAAARPSSTGSRRRMSFAELGWGCAHGSEPDPALAIDIGAESCCLTRFEQGFAKPSDRACPTMVLVEDPHAFRTLEPFALRYGLEAAERWPAEAVLRGRHGQLRLRSQIGLVDFPATHVLSGLVRSIEAELERLPRDVVLSLPTFLPWGAREAIRKVVSPRRKGCFQGVPGLVSAAYFYLTPALSGDGESRLVRWGHGALAAGRVLVLDWGASGLEYGLVRVRRSKPGELHLALELAGVWPSLGGHRLTLEIFRELRRGLLAALLEGGPADALALRSGFCPRSGDVPRPPGYERAFELLLARGEGVGPEEEEELERLRNLVFPLRWRFEGKDEPAGYAPYRKLAVRHFKEMWAAAEWMKRRALGAPAATRRRGGLAWDASELESPFLSGLDRDRIEVDLAGFVDKLEARLRSCLTHITGRLMGPHGRLPVAICGMQASSPLLRELLESLGAEPSSTGGARLWPAPASDQPLELKAVVNRGAAMLSRERRSVRLGEVGELLPFSLHIADSRGSIMLCPAGLLDELVVFQRRLSARGGRPRVEYIMYESEDGSRQGSWGAIDFARSVEFTEEDRRIAIDPRYGFGSQLPTLRELRGDGGEGLRLCFDRAEPGWTRGRISLRRYAPPDDRRAARLLHFLEHGLRGQFHRKVFLLEREFVVAPRSLDHVLQRYYLSYSQELLVVREWWAPGVDGALERQKHLYTCRGASEANAILELSWGAEI